MGNDITGGGLYLVIPASVAEDVRLRERSKLIYGRIAQLAASTGYCYASNQRLLEILSYQDPATGEVSSISERTLQSILAELRDLGHIHMDMGPVPVSGDGHETVRRRIFIGQKLADMPPDMGVKKSAPPAENCTPWVQKSAPPYKISKNNKSRINPLYPPPEVLDAIDSYIGDDPEYREAFEGFLANRAKLKKPVLTARSVNGIINRLRKVNHRETEIAMLDNATTHNWLTVYPLKADELPPAQSGRVVEAEGVEII